MENLSHSAQYQAARKFVVQYRSNPDLPVELEQWIKKMLTVPVEDLQMPDLHIPNGLNDWFRKEMLRYVDPQKLQPDTITFLQHYGMLTSIAASVIRPEDFNVWDFPVYIYDKNIRLDFQDIFCFYLLKRNSSPTFTANFTDHDWVNYKDKNGVEFVFHYLHKYKKFIDGHKFLSWHLKDPLGNTVMHYAALYGCLPVDLSDDLLSMENNDAVSVKQMRTIRLATMLNESTRFAEKLYDQ